MFRLAQRRTVLLPTLLGWACLVALGASCLLLWGLEGEAFLSRTNRLPAQVLVVEGWIGIEGITAAKAEFEQGGYSYVVTTSGMSGDKWTTRRWSFAGEAGELLVRLGVPADRVIIAPPPDTENHRTRESAEAAKRALAARDIRPKAVNVFTMGAHGRRSRLVFERVFRPDSGVGVVSWQPPSFEGQHWWQSSDRAVDFMKETVGYAFEIL